MTSTCTDPLPYGLPPYGSTTVCRDTIYILVAYYPGILRELPGYKTPPCLAWGTVGNQGIPVLPQWGTSGGFIGDLPGNYRLLPINRELPGKPMIITL